MAQPSGMESTDVVIDTDAAVVKVTMRSVNPRRQDADVSSLQHKCTAKE